MTREGCHRPGTTLVEVLVACVLLSLLLSLTAVMFATAYRTFSDSTRKTAAFRDLALSLDSMGRELRMCTRIYEPSPLAPGGLRSVPKIVFARSDPDGSQSVVAFAVNATSLERRQLPLDYPANQRPARVRVLTGSVTQLEIARASLVIGEVLQLRLTSQSVAPLSLEVTVRSL